MPAIPQIEVLEDLWVSKLAAVPGVASAFSIGMANELSKSERVFRMPAAMVLFAGMPANRPRNIGHPVVQEGVMRWTIFIVCESMRGRYAARGDEKGAYQIGAAIMAAIDGWDIIDDGWVVWIEDFRPFDVGEPKIAVYELVVAHMYDMTGI